MTQEEILALIVARMRATFDVRRIILFGSRARGDAGPDSDYDVLVEVNSDEPRRIRQRKGHLALADRRFPMDLLVLTPADVEAHGWALAEGRTLDAA